MPAAEAPKPRIGFVGIGNMGWPMAACLVRAGYQVCVADSRQAQADGFIAQVGGNAPGSLKALAEASEIVITILPTSTIVEQVMTGGQDNVLAGLLPGSVVIDMTSGMPSVTRRIAERVQEAGSTLIDAPVSGGVARAKTGELAIMVGGEDATVERVRPVLAAMGSSVLRTGGVGSGQAMKALNNLVSAGGFLIGVEALLIGQKFGLDPTVMVDVLNASTGMNNSTQKKFRQFVLSRSFASGFSLDLMVKDLSIALEVGRDGGTPAPFAALCREMWASAAALLGPGQDHTAIARLSEQLAGIELSG
ncbi:MAG: NAD(P)-dependent oxidoreductase [Acidisphaera sp.]|nr:NAD(P)-dependent oxidoreductase [Acidisphaera sp.]